MKKERGRIDRKEWTAEQKVLIIASVVAMVGLAAYRIAVAVEAIE